jgi:hypothetical protein
MLGTDIQIRKGLAYADGTADREGEIMDMANYEWIMAVFTLAAIHNSATCTIKWQQGAAPAMGDAADLLGTAMTVAGTDDNQLKISLLIKPRERYVRAYIDKDTSNTQAESLLYIMGGKRTQPSLVAVASETAVEIHESPAEGTA